jgi:general secretion pathway protein L
MAATPEFQASRAAPLRWLKLSAFWRWWTREISRLLPERFSLLRAGAGAPLLAVEGDEVALIEAPGAAAAGEKKISIAALDEPHRNAAVRSLLEGAGESRGRARVALPHQDVLVRRVTFPSATEENLGQVLAFEMDRLSPFRADEVYFDYRVIGRDAATGQITVELAIARRDAVDARVRRLRALGVSVQGVSLRDDANRTAAPLDLLPSEQRGQRETPRERLVRYAVLAAVLILFLGVLLLPIYKKREGVVALLPVVLQARKDAEASDAIVRDLERQVSDYNFLLTRRHGAHSADALIEDVSRLLPDNTWLQQLELKSAGKTREVLLSGETVSSSKLIEVLEQSKLLQNATTRGAVTRGSTPGTERFMIAAEVRPRPLPEAQLLGSAPPPAAATPTAVVLPAPAPAVAAPAATKADDSKAPSK